ncbi:hypothetical protein BBB39_14225 [Bordetella trematum]|uniref:Lipoprotein n=1 Tax=Bordetella trematum TaxID=123899 RepID=A0A157LES8_9BORD|nr:hypothetical protein [Bordetella trematum]AZR94809.1 hypothetical protein BBB39_14225 [Bordetella trematum]NNH20157.1 hypothetical protein [Bordetella trematum]SAH95120.1 Uncharacterised protein [Bordetella trematum]SAI74268.1 Uncharacterised protein [Bordetella trematum]SUV96923.1 Uncharacterised protein [Bordetella trematum]
MTFISRAALLAALCFAAGAQAQTASAQTDFPGSQPPHSSHWSPPSTLRMTVEPAPAAAAPLRDTPESIAEYQRCRAVSDRAAVSNQQRTAGVQACLSELQQRREMAQ